ncbi:MAG: D-alanyl-D-alanine carboxypeptidase/D-alanyl-D-alanine-endopeptidase [Sedimentisphaerales bacterium]
MKALTKKLLVVVVFSICLGTIAKADLAERVEAIISRPSQRKVQFSIHIVKADSGETVYSHNAAKMRLPASNMKIIVTAAALKYLGPDYAYITKVALYDDTLIVIGGGDPLLGDEKTDAKHGRERNWIFKDITATLKRHGVKTIKDIIIDTTIFDDQRVHPSWPKKELNRWYACEVSGLNFNDNCIAITAKNNSGKVAIFIEPQTDYVKFINKVTPISRGSSTVGSYRSREPNKIVIHGKCRKQAGPFDVAIENPAAFFAYLLAENLAKAAIFANGQIIEKAVADEDVRVLAEYSTALIDCLTRCNKDSLGLAAEALLKTIAAESNPERKNGSWTKGREIISKYLMELGISRNHFFIDDASGLSRKNRLSANAITKVLLNVYKSENWQIYKDSLAVGGVDGTIARYFKEQKYKGKILGKTGYISGAKSFSGICITKQGNYIFSILSNNANGQTRTAINDIAKAIIDTE